jgi:hypothetical protein
LPGYSGKQRWNYYRIRTEGHNTLTVDGQNEDQDAFAPLVTTVRSNSTDAIIDLGRAYKRTLSSWKQKISLKSDRTVLLEDDVEPLAPVTLCWNFHTAAQVRIAVDGHIALLRQGGRALRATIVSPSSGHFELLTAASEPEEAANQGISNLVIRLNGQLNPVKLVLLFSDVR